MSKSAVKHIQDQQAALARATGAERKGALVYWWLTGIMSHIDDVRALYEKHGLDWDKWGPPEQKATAAFRKTLKEVGRSINHKGGDQGYLIRLIDDSEDHLLYGIVREDKLRSQEDLVHDCEAKIKLKKESCQVVTSKNNNSDGYEIAQKVKDLFDTMFCHMIVQDFSRLLTRNIHMMAAVSIRPTGAIYFVPEGFRDTLVKLRSILEDVPGDSHLCAIDIWGAQPDLARDTKIALEQELKDLQEEIEKFRNRVPRQDCLKNRLQEYRVLQEKGRMFAELLDFNSSSITKGLEQCGKAVEVLLADGHFLGSEAQAMAKARAKSKIVRHVEEPTKKVRKPVKAASKKRRVGK